jgi:hypothetical protein
LPAIATALPPRTEARGRRRHGSRLGPAAADGRAAAAREKRAGGDGAQLAAAMACAIIRNGAGRRADDARAGLT